jgi:hypothetical protein
MSAEVGREFAVNDRGVELAFVVAAPCEQEQRLEAVFVHEDRVR